MSDFKIVLSNIEGRAKLEAEDPLRLEEAVQLFSYTKKQYGSFTTSALNGCGEYSCISPMFTFKEGLTLEIAKALKDSGYSIKISNELLNRVRPTCTLINENELIKPIGFDYRDYQERAIRTTQKKGRLLWESPTSSGKSAMLFGVCSNIKEYNERTLIIVPRTQLVEQFFKDWRTYGFQGVSMFSKKCPRLDPNSKVVITNFQWIVDKKNKAKNSKTSKMNMLLKAGFKAIIVDEAHTIGEAGSFISRFVNKFKTPYKLGCTGTIPDEKSRYWNCVGTIGPVYFREEIHKLQQKNQIAKVRIFPICLEHNTQKKSEKPFYRDKAGNFISTLTKEPLKDGREAFESEWKYVENHNGSNNIILDVIESLKGNTMVLSDHIEHVRYLYNNSKAKNKFLIEGKVKLDNRLAMAEEIDSFNNEQYTLFGITSAIGTGISIKNFSNLVIACHGKALTKIIQGIGRVLRKVLKDGEEEVYNVIDIYHNFLFSQKHFESRKKLYKKYYHKNAKIFKSILVPMNTQNEIRNGSTEDISQL